MSRVICAYNLYLIVLHIRSVSQRHDIYTYIFVYYRVPSTFGTRKVLFEVLLHDDSASIHYYYYILYGRAVYAYNLLLYTPIIFNSSASETQPQRGIKLVPRALYIKMYTRNILQTSHIYLFSLCPAPLPHSPPETHHRPERKKNVTCNMRIYVYVYGKFYGRDFASRITWRTVYIHYTYYYYYRPVTVLSIHYNVITRGLCDVQIIIIT